MAESGERVVVEMELDESHRNAAGAISTAVIFSLADCAMSLISNADRTAVAVATHLAADEVAHAGILRAVAVGRLSGEDRARTWDIEVLADGNRVGLFTGTTWTVD